MHVTAVDIFHGSSLLVDLLARELGDSHRGCGLLVHAQGQDHPEGAEGRRFQREEAEGWRLPLSRRQLCVARNLRVFGHRHQTSMTCATVEDSTAGLGQPLGQTPVRDVLWLVIPP